MIMVVANIPALILLEVTTVLVRQDSNLKEMFSVLVFVILIFLGILFMIDINECSLGISGCAHGCRNDVGKYHCICQTGYELADDNHTCIGQLMIIKIMLYMYLDINECDQNNGNCNQICVNKVGSYHCECKSGFIQHHTGFSCHGNNCISFVSFIYCLKDINECATNTDGCTHNCYNLKGSFYCGCNFGYALNSTDNKTCYGISTLMLYITMKEIV